jgi:hypothetical protein
MRPRQKQLPTNPQFNATLSPTLTYSSSANPLNRLIFFFDSETAFWHTTCVLEPGWRRPVLFRLQ